MAYLDKADLLARLKVRLARATTDEFTDANLYALLTEAQTYWYSQLAVHFPQILMVAPELMTTSDGGYTFTVASEPLGPLQVYDTNGGRLLRPGAEWDTSADYVPQGQTIRMTGYRPRTGVAPYARYIAHPGVIDASTEPTFEPTFMRTLLIERAAVLFATNGGLYDPTPYENAETKLWSGDPSRPGDVGFLGALKLGANGYGGAGAGEWWRSRDFTR